MLPRHTPAPRRSASPSSGSWPGSVGGRLQLVGDPREVLDDAVVQLGGDAAALGLERVLARPGEALVLALLGADAAVEEPGERELGERQGEQEHERHRQERLQDPPAGVADVARRMVGLEEELLAAARDEHRVVDLDQPALAALEAVLGAAEVADVGTRLAL